MFDVWESDLSWEFSVSPHDFTEGYVKLFSGNPNHKTHRKKCCI